MKYLGIDFGQKKIGLAVGNSVTGSSRPLACLRYHHFEDLRPAIKRLMAEWAIDKIIIGDPGPQEQNKRLNSDLNRFCDFLTTSFAVPIERESELYTSQEANTLLHDYPQHAKDAIAAMLILQSYLNKTISSSDND